MKRPGQNSGFRFAAPAAKKPLGIFGQGGAPGGGEVNEELQAMAATSGGLFSGTSAPAPRSSAPATKSVFQIKRPPMKLASKPVADPQVWQGVPGYGQRLKYFSEHRFIV